VADVKLSVPDAILADVRAAADKVAPGKKIRLTFALDVITKELHVNAVYRGKSWAVGTFVNKLPGVAPSLAVGGSIEFEPAP
jgi:hypothetical protein